MLLFMRFFLFREAMVHRLLLPTFVVAPYAPEELVEVRVVADPRHPAYGQAGLYARRLIPYNTVVAPYSGFIEVFTTSCNSRTYTMGFGSLGDDYALDAEFVGNCGRYANDPRGVGASVANLSAEHRFTNRGESFTALVARRQINKGEEILMSYGKAHLLCAAPWTNVQGEAVLRRRSGGIVPFPSLQAPTSPATAATTTPVVCSTPLSSSSSSSFAPAPSSPLPLSSSVMWECAQCGMWCCIDATAADGPALCTRCGSPKVAGAKLVGLLSCPPVTDGDLMREAAAALAEGPKTPAMDGHSKGEVTDASFPSPKRLLQLSTAAAPIDTDVPHLMTSSTRVQVDKEEASEKAGDASEGEDEESEAEAYGVDAAPSKPSLPTSPTLLTEDHPSLSSVPTSVDTSSPSSCDASFPISWPMNIPFLPWQVWDAAIPLAALTKHSKFESQEHIFLYTVDTDVARTDDKRKRPQKHSIGSTHPHGRGGGRGGGGDADDRPLLPSPTAHTGSSRCSSSAISSTTVPTREAEEEEAGPYTASAMHSAFPSLPTATVQSHSTPREVAAKVPPPPPPLSASELCGVGQDVDRLLLFPRRPTASASPIAAARQRLRCMTRRVLTGKSFQPGDVVSYIGGVIRPMEDHRSRPGNAPLEIPLRYFAPPALRRGMLSEVDDTMDGDDVSDFMSQMRHLSLVVTNEFMYCPCIVVADDEDGDSDGGGNLERFLPGAAPAPYFKRQRTEVEGAASVPYVERETGEKQARQMPLPEAERLSYNEELERLLESCNVALVMTLDSLGCPSACAVATRPINAFEALVARAQ